MACIKTVDDIVSSPARVTADELLRDAGISTVSVPRSAGSAAYPAPIPTQLRVLVAELARAGSPHERRRLAERARRSRGRAQARGASTADLAALDEAVRAAEAAAVEAVDDQADDDDTDDAGHSSPLAAARRAAAGALGGAFAAATVAAPGSTDAARLASHIQNPVVRSGIELVHKAGEATEADGEARKKRTETAEATEPDGRPTAAASAPPPARLVPVRYRVPLPGWDGDRLIGTAEDGQEAGRHAQTGSLPKVGSGQVSAPWATARHRRAEDRDEAGASSLAAIPSGRGEDVIEAASRKWINEHRAGAAGQGEVFETTIGRFTYLYEHSTDGVAQTMTRLIGAWGRSGRPDGPRAASRMRGFPSPQRDHDEAVHRGHVIAHSIGGADEGFNLVSQLGTLNVSPAWRNLERYCAAHPGTFLFVRALYDDPTSDEPSHLEYGISPDDDGFEVTRFPNLPTDLA